MLMLNITKPLCLAAAVGLLLSITARAQNTTNSAASEVNALVAKVNAKIDHGPVTEAVLAEDLKQFDDLLARHASEKTDDVAGILFMKAMLYVEVLKNPVQAQATFKQLVRDFPGCKYRQDADSAIAQLDKFVTAQQIRDHLVPGATFPGFDEKDINGQPLSLAALKGKVVLVDFWATWCMPCRVELPNVIANYKKYHDQGFEVVGVSMDKDLDALKKFTSANDMPWPQFCDGREFESKLGTKYGVDKLPTTFLLDREGKIIGKELRGEDLAKAISAAVAKQ